VSEPLGTCFQRMARHSPDSTALEVGGEQLSYAGLDELAGRVGAMVAAAVGGRPRAVGLCCSRSVAAYAGYLGALRAGATVVPLNPRFPAARNEEMFQAAQAGVLVVDDAGAAGSADALETSAPTVRLTGPRWRHEVLSADLTPLACQVGPDDVAYILFTSGSTGRPKGVPIRHRQLADYLAFCVERYRVGPGSRLSQTFDLTFDPSVFDMFVAWCGGATLVVPRPEDVLTPAGFVARRRITHWFSVPSAISLARRLRGLQPGSMSGLRWSLFAGEQLTIAQARAWAAAAPDAVIENLYGPTELTVTCTGYRLPRELARWPRTANGTVPIGRPNPHLEAVLLTDEGTVGSEGELCVRGSQRFDGYLEAGDGEGCFVRIVNGLAVPAAGGPAREDWYRTGDRVRWQDGELVHLGRIDEQVKISGHRVEPGEVECVLREHAGVDEAVVLAVADGAGQVELHGFHTGTVEPGPTLIEHARRRLPPYMVPARLERLEQFPISSSGKIDRRRLRQLLAPGLPRSDARRRPPAPAPDRPPAPEEMP
jgi:amino acid adenylation domain-containing protein